MVGSEAVLGNQQSARPEDLIGSVTKNGAEDGGQPLAEQVAEQSRG